MSGTNLLTDLERRSVLFVLLSMASGLAAATLGGVYGLPLLLAVGMGALGGLVHEIARSEGVGEAAGGEPPEPKRDETGTSEPGGATRAALLEDLMKKLPEKPLAPSGR